MQWEHHVHRHRENAREDRQTLELYCKPQNTQGQQTLEEAKKDPPLQISEEIWSFDTLIQNLWPPKPKDKELSLLLATQFGTLSQQPQGANRWVLSVNANPILNEECQNSIMGPYLQNEEDGITGKLAQPSNAGLLTPSNNLLKHRDVNIISEKDSSSRQLWPDFSSQRSASLNPNQTCPQAV